MPVAYLIVEDLRLPASPVLLGPDGILVFARVLASSPEARGLRHAVGQGLPGALHAGERRALALDPATRIREERIWVKGIPKTRIALYLPGRNGWLFWAGPSDFYDFIEAAADLPVPAPERRMAGAGAALQALAHLHGPDLADPPPPVRDLARALARAEGWRRPGDVVDGLRAVREGLRPLAAFGLPEGWAALAVREEVLRRLLPALRT